MLLRRKVPQDLEDSVHAAQLEAIKQDDINCIERTVIYRQIWDAVYPEVALFLLQYLSRLIDSGVMSADEVALDIPEVAIREGVRRFNKAQAGDCSFISFCKYLGKTVSWNHVPESCPVSFVAAGSNDGDAIEDHRYKWALKLKINSFRSRYYGQHREFPPDEATGEAFRISTKMVRTLMGLSWFSLNADSGESTNSSLLAPQLMISSCETELIEEEARQGLNQKFVLLSSEVKRKTGIAGVLSVLDGRKNELDEDEIEVLETSLKLMNWSEEENESVRRCLKENISRSELAKVFMTKLQKSSSKESIRQLRHQLKNELSKQFKLAPYG